MIRRYKQSDANAVKVIAHSEDKQRSMRCASSLRCDYFIDNEPEHCFVMTDEFDKPTGYILCSTSRDRFAALFPAYLSIVRQEDKRLYAAQKKLFKKIISARSAYAYFTLDVLPSFRDKGGGKELVNTLIRHLTDIEVMGACTLADTPSAIAFCERIGFERILRVSKTSGIYLFKINTI